MSAFRAAALAALACLSATAAEAATTVYQANLSGANESPTNASPGTGIAFVTIDDVANTMRVQVTFQDLTSGVTASHIHCCTTLAFAGTAGVATVTPTFTGFPSGVTSGTYDMTYSLLASSGTYNSAFVTANGGTPGSAEAVLLSGISAGKSYLNIHTTNFGGGEIRGFLTAVPEPAEWAMMLTGFGLMGLMLRRRRRLVAV